MKNREAIIICIIQQFEADSIDFLLKKQSVQGLPFPFCKSHQHFDNRMRKISKFRTFTQ